MEASRSALGNMIYCDGRMLIMILVPIIGVMIAQMIIIIHSSITKKKSDKNQDKNQDEKGFDKDGVLEILKNFWPQIVFYLFATSIISIFALSLVFDKNLTLANLNNWIGIILGFSSWIISIISLYLSFYTVDKSMNKMESIGKTIENTAKSLNGDGWKHDEIGWIYLVDGEKVVNQIKKSGNSYYYLGKYGYVEKNTMVDIEGKKYCFNENGAMVMNGLFITQDGKKVFCGSDGSVIEKGEVIFNNIKYTIENYYVIKETPVD